MNMATSASRDTRGTVMVEVMLAVLILSIGLLGIVGSLRAAWALHRELRVRTEAVEHLREVMARVQVGEFGGAEHHEGRLPDEDGPFRWEVTVEASADPRWEDLAEARIGVGWGPGAGTRMETTLLVRLGEVDE